MWKYELEYRIDKPETEGETDKHFDLDNYKDWLEEQLTNCRKHENEQMHQDIRFLAERQLKAGSVSFTGERETGISSNSIVAIIYGLEPLEKQRFPSDVSDMESCENMWKKLPEHRKTGDGLKAMEAARNCDYYGKR